MQAQTIADGPASWARRSSHMAAPPLQRPVRFKALRTLASNSDSGPVRDRAFKRPEQLKYLEDRGLTIPPHGAAYSINRGLWGVTIGGKETLTSDGSIPDDAWVLSREAFSAPKPPERHTIGFTRGVPSSLDGEALAPVALIENVETIGARR
jgi:argininosuccinate synthase